MDGLDEVARLGKVVGHMSGVAPVHADYGEGVLGDLLLCQRNCYMSEATRSKRRQSTDR